MKNRPVSRTKAAPKRVAAPSRGKARAGPKRTAQRARGKRSAESPDTAEKKKAARLGIFRKLVLANALALAERESGSGAGQRGPRSEDWTVGFCEAVRNNGGYVRPACRTVGVARSAVYERMESDPEFKARVEEACADAVEASEATLYIRGVHGVEKPVWFQGLRVGADLEYSDGCLTKYLEAKKPEVYGRKTTLQNPDGSAFSITIKRASEERAGA